MKLKDICGLYLLCENFSFLFLLLVKFIDFRNYFNKFLVGSKILCIFLIFLVILVVYDFSLYFVWLNIFCSYFLKYYEIFISDLMKNLILGGYEEFLFMVMFFWIEFFVEEFIYFWFWFKVVRNIIVSSWISNEVLYLIYRVMFFDNWID